MLLLFLALAVSLRYGSFFPSVIDHDESTYIVIAKSMLEGYVYQVDYIDTKPIGIFLVYALIQFLFGPPIWIMRLVGTLALAATSFFLYRAKLRAGSKAGASIAAGVIYIFLNSIYTTYGVSPNTETYFNLFTALALWLYMSQGAGWRYALAGLSLGVGFIFKYVVLFDGIALGLFLLWQAGNRQISWGYAWRNSLLMASFAAIPFLAVMMYYWQMGELDTFWFYTFVVSGRYPSSTPLTGHLLFLGEFMLRFLPVVVLYAVVLIRRNALKPANTWILGILWSILTLIVVLLPGNSFGHYFIQFMLPLSFLSGEFFSLPASRIPRWLRWSRNPRIGYPLLLVLLITLLALQPKDYILKPDHQRITADYLNANMGPEDQIYTDENHIIYYLTDRLPLIPYVHPSLFWRDKHIEAMEIPLDATIAEITDARPRFLVFRFPLEEERFADFRNQYYQPVKIIDDFCTIYERKPGGDSNGQD
jgi:4-amino-4-deoxy-L-arabinose transferase-like glycosyltransferase